MATMRVHLAPTFTAPRSMRLIAVCGLLLAILPSQLAGVPAPTDANPPPEPTAEQLADAKEAFAKFGAVLNTGRNQQTKQISYAFYMPNNTTDADLKALPNLPFRFVMVLRNCSEVTNAGLNELKTLKNLIGLFLGSTKVTDAGLKELNEFKNLASLGLGGKSVTDAWLKEVKNLKNLTELIIIDTDVTDVGLTEIKELKNLNYLCLEEVNVTDTGLKHLKELKALTRLELRGTKTTGKGLKELANLKNLTHLDLERTQVTEADVRELQKALPKCEILKPRGISREKKSDIRDEKKKKDIREAGTP